MKKRVNTHKLPYILYVVILHTGYRATAPVYYAKKRRNQRVQRFLVCVCGKCERSRSVVVYIGFQTTCKVLHIRDTSEWRSCARRAVIKLPRRKRGRSPYYAGYPILTRRECLRLYVYSITNAFLTKQF